MAKPEQPNLISCPNNCELEKFPLTDMDKHLAECPLELVTCEFADAGCTVKLERRELKHHMMEKQQEHLVSATLMNLKLTKESIAEKDCQLAEKDSIIAAKDRQIVELQNQLRTLQETFMDSTKVALDRFLGIEPHDLLVEGFSTIHELKKGWQSQPFFSHIGGYKLVLHIDTHEPHHKSKEYVEYQWGRFLRVYLHAICPNDLPATFSVTLQLLNQLKNKHHYTRNFQLTMSNRDSILSGPSINSGVYNYISFQDLYRRDEYEQIRYLVNDCLKFRMWLHFVNGSQYRHQN